MRRAIIALGMMRAWVWLTRSLTVAPLLRLALLMIVVLTWGPGAYALDPALDVGQYAHTAWKIREGLFKSYITSIAQTPDGYLWLGTEFGLLRFDGVRSVPWEPPTGEHLPGGRIRSLLPARDGTLWIGTDKGLASWKNNKLTQYPELAGDGFVSLLEDRAGTVWASGWGTPNGRLCAIQSGSAQCYGGDGRFGQYVESLYEDRLGNIWVGAATGLWRWRPGPPKLYPMPSVNGLSEGDNGTLLILTRDGIRQIVDGKDETHPLPDIGQHFTPTGLLRDRDGGLWIGTSDRGLLHVHQGKMDLFTQSDGLSGDFITSLFEDREGNIWVATFNGLDRFRDFAVATISIKQGLSNAFVLSVLATRDGSVWLGTLNGLNRWKDGQITIYRKRSAQTSAQLGAPGAVHEVADSGLPDNSVESLFQDDSGRIWVSTLGGVAYFENGRFIVVSALPRGWASSTVGESAGNLWISYEHNDLFHLLGGRVVERIPWATLGRKDWAFSLLPDSLQGGLWLGFRDGGVAHLKDGHVVASYGGADGLGEGLVNGLQRDQDGTLWAATEGGLSRVKNGRVATLSHKNGLPCDTVHWMIEDDAHSVWLYMSCGLVRIARPELDAWTASVDKGGDKDSQRTIRATVFDSSDGVRSGLSATGSNPQVAKTADGKLWFAVYDGVAVVDPRHLPVNNLPPPVHIEQVTADHKTYDATFPQTRDRNGQLRLPPLVRDLEIDYTALSLVAPEKVRFRYKLEGWDRDWQDAGTRRQAFYTNLSPRKYRFRLMACNNSGVWNDAGTFLDFSVAPAYYQTIWFRSLCVAAFLVLLWGLYQLRLRQLAREFNAGLEARVNERTRIARELHDTMLQSFHGLLLRFQTVSNLLPAGEPKGKLDRAIDQAAQAITEGRDAVQGLRSSTTVTNDLACAITTLGTELASSESNPNAAEFHVEVEGTPRDLHPILRDEVYRIAGEAVRNAFKHAQAGRIEVEIRYDERQLRVRVRDDGKGIDAKHLNKDGRPGHYGLRGMRERAKLLGGKLAVWSEVDSGTEVELRIPASRAYETSPTRRRWWLAEKFSGKDTEVKS